MRETTDISRVVDTIVSLRRRVPEHRSVMVGVSGIDGSGKGFLAEQLKVRLWQRSIPTVVINVDRWLNLPEKRFNQTEPAEHFYRHAIRFDEILHDVVVPLQNSRSLDVETDFAQETARSFQRTKLRFEDEDVVIVEGIFLFKQVLRDYFDLRVWIDCSFSTALTRAIKRRQEGLPISATIHAYDTIYFPAQKLHFERDNPRSVADLILDNDPYPSPAIAV